MRNALLLIVFVAACSKPEKAEPKTEPKPALTPGVLRGTIDIKPELAAQVAPGDSLFIAARKGQGGPPLAVARLTLGPFPIAFELTKDNVMVAGAGELDGVVELTVRIDKDGDAMTRNPGDLFAKVPGVQVGDTAIKVVIDQVQP